ncbi:hypothetical protein ACSBR2_017996 [Camellia fascicularis]
MGARGLYNIFSNYGIVMDAFIPNKRRKMTRSHFGFVRYSCSVAADIAVQKAHGLWCDDRALRVKMADFGKESGPLPRSNQAPQTRKVIAVNTMHTIGHQRNRSFAEVVSGRGGQTNAIRTIKAYEEGNGLLYESVVVRLKAFSSMDTFKEDITMRGFGEVKVRWRGWKRHGVPLNLWSFTTFRSIGETWGAVLAIDEDTLRLNSLHCGKVKIATSSMKPINHIINLECKGTIYPVRVCEEQIIVSKSPSDQCTSQPTEWKIAGKTIPEAIADEQLTDINNRHEVEDDDVDIQLLH